MFTAWLFFRSTLFHLGYIPMGIIIGLCSPALMLLPQNWGLAVILFWNRFTLWWLKICCGVHCQVSGYLNTPPAGCVIISNHQCFWETIFLQLHFIPIATVLKKELLSIPFFGWGLRLLKPIAIDRSTPVQALKQVKAKGVERLQGGDHVLIFPEGTRMPYGELGEYKRSGADIARRAGVSIIPVAHNAGKFWPNKRFLKFPGTIQLVVGEPIDCDHKDTKQLMSEIHDWTQQQIEKMA